MIYLVHHADAVGSEVDPQRPLSSAGKTHAERLARDVASRGVRPTTIRHSGKLRARQTAEAFQRACNPLAQLTAVRGLQPADPPEWMRDLLIGETQDVMLVGHMPNLPRLLTLLVEGPEGPPRSFPQHGIVAIEAVGEKWEERWRI